jgi:hypothetical protein
MSSTIIPTNIIPTNIQTNMLTESVMNTIATPKKRGRPNKYDTDEERSAVRKAQNASSYAKRKSLQPPKTHKQSRIVYPRVYPKEVCIICAKLYQCGKKHEHYRSKNHVIAAMARHIRHLYEKLTAIS